MVKALDQGKKEEPVNERKGEYLKMCTRGINLSL